MEVDRGVTEGSAHDDTDNNRASSVTRVREQTSVLERANTAFGVQVLDPTLRAEYAPTSAPSVRLCKGDLRLRRSRARAQRSADSSAVAASVFASRTFTITAQPSASP